MQVLPWHQSAKLWLGIHLLFWLLLSLTLPCRERRDFFSPTTKSCRQGAPVNNPQAISSHSGFCWSQQRPQDLSDCAGWHNEEGCNFFSWQGEVCALPLYPVPGECQNSPLWLGGAARSQPRPCRTPYCVGMERHWAGRPPKAGGHQGARQTFCQY